MYLEITCLFQSVGIPRRREPEILFCGGVSTPIHLGLSRWTKNVIPTENGHRWHPPSLTHGPQEMIRHPAYKTTDCVPVGLYTYATHARDAILCVEPRIVALVRGCLWKCRRRAYSRLRRCRNVWEYMARSTSSTTTGIERTFTWEIIFVRMPWLNQERMQ